MKKLNPGKFSNLILCSNLNSDSGISQSHLLFIPRILRGFQKSLEFNPGKNYPKNLTHFFALAEVIRSQYDLLRCLICVHKTFKADCKKFSDERDS